MTVTPLILTDAMPQLFSTYCSTLRHEPACDEADATIWLDKRTDFTFNYTVQAPDERVLVDLYHGRLDTSQDMSDWGFTGPVFECGNVAHSPENMLLQECDAVSLQLARRIGLTVHHDTISMTYFDGLLVVPRFKDDAPAYFGDFSLTRHLPKKHKETA
jgi:hypothetical protein